MMKNLFFDTPFSKPEPLSFPPEPINPHSLETPYLCRYCREHAEDPIDASEHIYEHYLRKSKAPQTRLARSLWLSVRPAVLAHRMCAKCFLKQHKFQLAPEEVEVPLPMKIESASAVPAGVKEQEHENGFWRSNFKKKNRL
jgi:hypothetical protein